MKTIQKITTGILILMAGLTKGQVYTDLFNFNGADGGHPEGDLTISGGLMLGTTSSGGASGYGNVFSIHTDGTAYKDLMDFSGTNGKWPAFGPLVLLGNVLYGITIGGGAHDSGCVYMIDTNGNNYKDLYDFDGSNGAAPYGALTLSGNTLFGMTYSGGPNKRGTIFSIKTNGSQYKMPSSEIYVSHPYGSLILIGSKLYGMTNVGGVNSKGCIFSIDTANWTSGGATADVYDFSTTNGFGDNSTGANPWGSLTFSALTSTLYGMTFDGGANGYGCIFSLDTNGTNFIDMLDFTNTNGANPHGSLLLSGTKLYGMTYIGGSSSDGVIFTINANGSGYKDLYNFTSTTGINPYGSLMLSGSILYGMTEGGGTSSEGTIFSFNDSSVTTSVGELVSAPDNIRLYPIPSNGILHIDGITEGIIELYDLTGRLLMKEEIKGNMQLDLSGYDSGVYFLQVVTGNAIINRKIEKL